MCKISFAVLCLFFVGAFGKEEDVLELGDSDFDSVLAQHETALVMFYAPWCGHCKRLKPEYAIAAEDLLRNDPPVTLVKVDCTAAGKETCNKNSVSGYPTLKIFRKGVLSQDYNGPREASGIVKFMKGQVGPSSKELSSVADLEKFLKRDNDVAVVGFFEKESDLKAAFLQLADKLRETTRFAHSSFKDVLEKQGEKDAIILFRPALLKNKFEDSSVKYTGKADSSDLDAFIKRNYHGLVGLRQADNARDFHDPLVIVYYDVDYKRNAKGTNYWRNRVLKVAKEYQDRVSFAISNSDDLYKELQDFGLEYNKGDKPKVAARDVKGQKFVMEAEFSVEALDKFVQDMLSGRLEPHLKSEPIPESQDEPVKVAVAKNFEELVMENGKDTLIEFYAPWCGHCKKLTPIYTEVAEKLKDEDVAIVKMDATANDVPSGFEVRGFPTLFWLPKDAKDKPVSYEGGRDTDDFIKYIAKHATNELKGFDREGNPKEVGKTEL